MIQKGEHCCREMPGGDTGPRRQTPRRVRLPLGTVPRAQLPHIPHLPRLSWFGAALHTRQGVSENWSCSVGFSTQAPSPALMKALNRQALAAWYSLATSLDSWYTLGLVILDRSKLEGTCRKI